MIKGEKTEIIQDNSVPLIFVQELVHQIFQSIKLKGTHKIQIPHQISRKVSQILLQLEDFHSNYVKNGTIPKLESLFDVQLFNTFRSALNPIECSPNYYKVHSDERGNFTELLRTHSKGQVSFSVTRPGVTRGNHFHTRKIERFSVIQGQAKITFRTIGTEKTIEFMLSGSKLAYIDIPVWTTHNITNIGSEDLITIFWINEHYDQDNADVYFEKV